MKVAESKVIRHDTTTIKHDEVLDENGLIIQAAWEETIVTPIRGVVYKEVTKESTGE